MMQKTMGVINATSPGGSDDGTPRPAVPAIFLTDLGKSAAVPTTEFNSLTESPFD